MTGVTRYDLWKLRAKGLVEKIPHSRRYRLPPHGYQICLVFLKLYDKLYTPLTAGNVKVLKGGVEAWKAAGYAMN